MITLDLDISRRQLIPPEIPELTFQGLLVRDFQGGTVPRVWEAMIDTGCLYSMIPVRALDHIFPDKIGELRVRDFRDMSSIVVEPLYKVSLFFPGEGEVITYAIFVPCSQVLLGRAALKEFNLGMNFATGKGHLSRVP